MNISPFLSIRQPWDQTLHWAKGQLTRAGLRPVQTFDLSAARLALQDCPCPHHGTEKCDCQMVVVLVYGAAEEPVTLILHGSSGQTWLSIAEAPRGKTNAKIAAAIEGALKP